MKQKPVHAAMQPFLDGKLALIDKPLHWTSFDAVKKKNFNGGLKVGHAGTLDSLATGLLVICTGKFTRKIPDYVGLDKEYTGTMTQKEQRQLPMTLKVDRKISRIQINLSEREFVKLPQNSRARYCRCRPHTQQLNKVANQCIYLQEKGKSVVLTPRKIVVTAFEITRIALPEIHFKVTCSTGTYIRSLVHDFGQSLTTGAYLSSLRRTRVGEFLVEEAKSPQVFEEEIRRLKEASERQAYS